jgi:hypothetical protein
MGLVESKKNGVVKKYELKLKLDAPIKNLLLPLTNCIIYIKKGVLQISKSSIALLLENPNVHLSTSLSSTK